MTEVFWQAAAAADAGRCLAAGAKVNGETVCRLYRGS